MEYKVKYLIGYPSWDNPVSVNIIINKGFVRIYDSSNEKEIIINAANIKDISFEAMKKRSGASAATGALIGGVLTGGIGLLAGAAIGAKAKDKSEITLLFDENGRDRTISLQTKEKTNAIFNAIQDAIEDAKNTDYEAEEQPDLRTEVEKFNDDHPTTTTQIVITAVIIIGLVLFVCVKCI